MSENETTKRTKFTKENQREPSSIPPFVLFVFFVVEDFGPRHPQVPVVASKGRLHAEDATSGNGLMVLVVK